MQHEYFEQLLQQKQYEQIINECNIMIQNNTQDEQIYYYRGMSKYYQEKYMEAFTDGVTSSRMNPDQSKGLEVIALSLIKMNKLQEARRVIEKGLSMNENEFWNNLYMEVQEKDTTQFNPSQMFVNWEERLNQNKRTKEYLKDESFKEYLTEIIENPLLLKSGVQDPKLSECLMVLMNVDMNQFLNKDSKTNLWGEAVKKQKEEEMINEMKREGIDTTQMEKDHMEESPQEVKDLLDKSFSNHHSQQSSQRFGNQQTNQQSNSINMMNRQIPISQNIEERKKLAEIEKEKGNEFYKKKMFTEAIECYNKAISLDRSNYLYQLNKTAVFYEMKQYQYVIQICQNIIHKIDDKQRHCRIATRLANSYFELKQYEAAEKYYDIALKDDCGNTVELQQKYNTAKSLAEQQHQSHVLNGPQMTPEIERFLMHDEVRYIIRMVKEDSNNMKKLRKDPKYRNYIERMIQLGILQSST